MIVRCELSDNAPLEGNYEFSTKVRSVAAMYFASVNVELQWKITLVVRLSDTQRLLELLDSSCSLLLYVNPPYIHQALVSSLDANLEYRLVTMLRCTGVLLPTFKCVMTCNG